MRTLVLMLELLLAVVSFQYLTVARQIKPDAVWLADDSITAPSCESANT